MRSRRSLVVVMIAGSLAFGAVPAHSYARIHVGDRIGRASGEAVGEEVAIGLGVTTGVVALVAAAV